MKKIKDFFIKFKYKIFCCLSVFLSFFCLTSFTPGVDDSEFVESFTIKANSSSSYNDLIFVNQSSTDLDFTYSNNYTYDYSQLDITYYNNTLTINNFLDTLKIKTFNLNGVLTNDIYLSRNSNITYTNVSYFFVYQYIDINNISVIYPNSFYTNVEMAKTISFNSRREIQLPTNTFIFLQSMLFYNINGKIYTTDHNANRAWNTSFTYLFNNIVGSSLHQQTWSVDFGFDDYSIIFDYMNVSTDLYLVENENTFPLFSNNFIENNSVVFNNTAYTQAGESFDNVSLRFKVKNFESNSNDIQIKMLINFTMNSGGKIQSMNKHINVFYENNNTGIFSVSFMPDDLFLSNYVSNADTLFSICINSFDILGYIPPEVDIEVVDIGSLMFTILSLPFSFFSQAFNFTLFAGTPYAINIADTLLLVLIVLIIIWLIKLIMSIKG